MEKAHINAISDYYQLVTFLKTCCFLSFISNFLHHVLLFTFPDKTRGFLSPTPWWVIQLPLIFLSSLERPKTQPSRLIR